MLDREVRLPDISDAGKFRRGMSTRGSKIDISGDRRVGRDRPADGGRLRNP